MASKYAFPQQAPGIDPASGERGIASMYHPDVGTLRFRSNPNEFNWTYTLNKRLDTTYGGRVVQLLGVKIDDFTFKADCGAGRWAYMNKVAKFMRECAETPPAQRHVIDCPFIRGGIQIAEMP